MASAIKAIHKQLQNKEISCVDLIQQKLKQLESSDKNTANFILADYALDLAKKVDQKIAQGEELGLLEGVPFGIKDVYLLEGTFTSASSHFLKEYKSPYTATAIQKLLDAGAIPIVKENCDSFGHGSSSENTVFGPVKNAIDANNVAGGSSGGSAVNVATGLTTFSIGGDTGGSIRQPAGYNKVYGLKPSYGRVSRYGLMAYASSTDCVGPIASSLEDIQLVLNTISGKDYHDQTSYDAPLVKINDEGTVLPKGTKIGYYKNFIESDALDPSMKANFLALIDQLKAEGMQIVPLEFFDDSILVATYYALAMAETASNLARLDGSMYGNRIAGENLKESYAITRSENFTAETKRRIVGGNQVLSQGHAEEIYTKAQQLRKQIKRHFKADFEKVAVVLSPVTPNPVPKIGEALKDPMTMYLSDAYTVGFSLGGLPTLTVPLALETGIQITAAHKQDEILFSCAHLLKKVL